MGVIKPFNIENKYNTIEAERKYKNSYLGQDDSIYIKKNDLIKFLKNWARDQDDEETERIIKKTADRIDGLVSKEEVDKIFKEADKKNKPNKNNEEKEESGELTIWSKIKNFFSL